MPADEDVFYSDDPKVFTSGSPANGVVDLTALNGGRLEISTQDYLSDQCVSVTISREEAARMAAWLRNFAEAEGAS